MHLSIERKASQVSSFLHTFMSYNRDSYGQSRGDDPYSGNYVARSGRYEARDGDPRDRNPRVRDQRVRDSRDRDPRDRDPRDRNPRDRDPRDRARDTRGPDPRARRDNRYDGYRDGYDSRENKGRYNGSRARYDDRSSYNRADHGRERRPKTQEAPVDPDAGLSKDEIITKYENKLIGLLKYPAIEVFPVASSQWGSKPKGFETVTAQRAKLSGLFPLPGAPRPIDLTKVEGSLQDGMTETGVLLGASKIDPADSRNSCIIIAKDIDFLQVDHMKVAEYFNRFLCSVDLKGTALDNNIEKKRKNRDNQNMIIEFKNNTCATLALALDGKKISGAEVCINEGSVPEDITLKLERPGEYVVQCLPPYDSESDVLDEVKDSPRKITLFVDKSATETALTNALSSVAKLRAFQLLREVGTKELTGIAYVEYFVDPKRYPNTKSALKLISDYVDETKELELVKDVRFSCVKISSDKGIETSIQDCPIDFKTLRALVRNEYVPFHPKLRVIQLINAVTATDLSNEETYNFVKQDILDEAKEFGAVVSWKMPKPPKDFVPGLQQFNQPGLGKVYLEFEDEKIALSALMGLAGRSYNDRTVLCAFYSRDDYLQGLL